MAMILNYIPSVTFSFTPFSSDTNSNSNPNQRPTKIILPNKKPLKWSTGAAPGDYGGPPTTSKLRKYWGGGEEDPLTSDEFIWNKDFVGRFKRMVNEDPDDVSTVQASPAKEDSSGFLSLNRVMSLDSLEVDLTKELTAPSKYVAEPLVETPKQSNSSASRRWRLAPTRREQEKWDKATKAATGGSDVLVRESRQPRGDPVVLAAQSREQYFKLKKKLQLLTLGIGGVGLVSAYVSYSPEIAASFGAGLLGSLIYIRMLGSSVDSMGDAASGAQKVIKGAAVFDSLEIHLQGSSRTAKASCSCSFSHDLQSVECDPCSGIWCYAVRIDTNASWVLHI